MKKIKVGILGATGMVGQRLITLLVDHPWFEISVLAASNKSSGLTYSEAVKNRWKLNIPLPGQVKKIRCLDVVSDIAKYSPEVSLVFSALNLDREGIKNLENTLAETGLAVISNNSAHRFTPDVPMVIPEINPGHLKLINIQRKKRGIKGFIVVKPNCSIQSYLPVICALKKFGPQKIIVTTLQAISGAGKTFSDWPEMTDNVIPYIGGEEEKTEKEPLRILGSFKNGEIIASSLPVVSATCIRVPVSDGHQASVSVKFKNNPSLGQITDAIVLFNRSVITKGLPSSPNRFIHYFSQNDRPQTRLDRDLENGMAISVGRFREDAVLDWKFISLSHNTLRGAAGGGVLTAELLHREGYL